MDSVEAVFFLSWVVMAIIDDQSIFQHTKGNCHISPSNTTELIKCQKIISQTSSWITCTNHFLLNSYDHMALLIWREKRHKGQLQWLFTLDHVLCARLKISSIYSRYMIEINSLVTKHSNIITQDKSGKGQLSKRIFWTIYINISILY